jgi:hypothetical protein
MAMRAITWWYMENVMSFFSENKNSTYNGQDRIDILGHVVSDGEVTKKIQQILLIKL